MQSSASPRPFWQTPIHEDHLGVGVYKDATGKTPIMRSVKGAEQRILQNESTKDYLGIQVVPETRGVQELLFGQGHPLLEERRAATAHSPGGTAALRVAADLLKKLFPKSTIWLNHPTWPTDAIFQAAGLAVRTYPYFNPATNALAIDAMLSLQEVPSGDVVLLHACCHNPTGSIPRRRNGNKLQPGEGNGSAAPRRFRLSRARRRHPRRCGGPGRHGCTRFVTQALSGKPVTVYETGRQQRCFCHIADAVEALVGLMDDERAYGKIFNVGTQEETTIVDLARRVIAAANSSSEIAFVPYERGL